MEETLETELVQAAAAISEADIEEELRGLESFVSPDILQNEVQWLLAPVEVRESQDPLVQTENTATDVN